MARLHRDFLIRYYTNGTTREKEYAVENTVFLLAQFLGWTELIRQEIQFLDLGTTGTSRQSRRGSTVEAQHSTEPMDALDNTES